MLARTPRSALPPRRRRSRPHPTNWGNVVLVVFVLAVVAPAVGAGLGVLVALYQIGGLVGDTMLRLGGG